MALTLKIAVVGAVKSGKTVISNLLSENDLHNNEYDPTVGCRILEFAVNVDGRSIDGSRVERDVKILVELWDMSGNKQYERCWPAASKNLNGLLLLLDPSSQASQQEATIWYQWFSESAGLAETQTLVLANTYDGPGVRLPKLPAPLDKLKVASVAVDDAESLRLEFSQFAGVLFGFHPDAEFLDD